MSARHLVIGLDGADLELVLALGAAQLPALHALLGEGVYAHLESVRPAATLPNWTTFLTALDPGEHGVFDFTTRSGYRVKFTAGTVREAPTWIARLDKLGLACACLGFPATWPPERLANGAFVSGWDAPVAFEGNASFVWPRGLYDELHARFGSLRFDDIDEFAADGPGWHRKLGRALEARVERRVEWLSYLLHSRSWDVFACYFGESDTASHYLWSLYDETSPRRPLGACLEERQGLLQVYRALDRAVARLLAEAGDAVELTIVSDHGSGGSSDKVLYLNRALAQAGLCTLRGEGLSAASVLKEQVLTRMPRRLRDALFRAAGAALPSLLESRARFGNIDMARSVAFSDELNYFPGVWLNVRGREPRGIVEPRELARARAQVREALLSLCDPWSGKRVVRQVLAREDVYAGPFLERAPDLVLELNLDRGYSYNLMPTASAPAGTSAFRRLDEGELLGRKGRSLPGSHRPNGLYIAAGPSVRARGRIDLDMHSAAAVTLTRIGVQLPARARGVVPSDLLADAREHAALPNASVSAVPASADFARVEARLRALGYVD